MDVDAATAAALGWPKLKYAFVERERRWLCDRVPHALVVAAETITDRYVVGTRLRLREAVPHDGGAPQRRLARKADVAADTRLITSIYLTADEYALLAALPARTLRKVRHKLRPIGGVAPALDVFEDALAGLILAEAEFDDDAAMRAYPMPDFCRCEVTDDPRYGGGALVMAEAPPP